MQPKVAKLTSSHENDKITRFCPTLLCNLQTKLMPKSLVVIDICINDLSVLYLSKNVCSKFNFLFAQSDIQSGSLFMVVLFETDQMLWSVLKSVYLCGSICSVWLSPCWTLTSLRNYTWHSILEKQSREMLLGRA